MSITITVLVLAGKPQRKPKKLGITVDMSITITALVLAGSLKESQRN